MKVLLPISLLFAVCVCAKQSSQNLEEIPFQENQEVQAVLPDQEEEVAGFFWSASSSCPAACHWVRSVSVFGESCELEDGSVWQIDPSDSTELIRWSASDPIIVTQTDHWFSSYKYRLMNKNRGTAVEAKIALGPVNQGTYSKKIVSIDQKNKVITLSDNTVWIVSWLDTSSFPNWSVGNSIILGTNSVTGAFISPYILINVNMGQYLRAKKQ